MTPKELNDIKPGQLFVEGSFALAVGDVDLTAAETNHSASNAETVLRLISLAQASSDHEENPRVGQELARLDAKLDVVIALLSTLLAQSAALPPAVSCRLYADGLLWNSTDTIDLKVGEKIQLTIYLNPTIPIPLKIPSITRAILRLAGQTWTLAEFDGLDREIAELLERFIFLRHRIWIASGHRS
jgi:hypothetical protein